MESIMAKEQVVKLFRAAQMNPSLRDELNTAPDVDTFVKLAGERGYEFTTEEWQEVVRFSVEELKSHVSEIPGI
jgi:predicted ribosomally synthesized peptide with nif11-like leader